MPRGSGRSTPPQPSPGSAYPYEEPDRYGSQDKPHEPASWIIAAIGHAYEATGTPVQHHGPLVGREARATRGTRPDGPHRLRVSTRVTSRGVGSGTLRGGTPRWRHLAIRPSTGEHFGSVQAVIRAPTILV